MTQPTMFCYLESLPEKSGEWIYHPGAEVIKNPTPLFQQMISDSGTFSKIGLPFTISQALLSLANKHIDSYSHGSITIDNLIQYNWSKTIEFHGIVDLENLVEFVLEGKPNAWFLDATNVDIVDAGTAIGAINEILLRQLQIKPSHIKSAWDMFKSENSVREAIKSVVPPGRYYELNWSIPYLELVGDLFSRIVPLSGRYGTPQNVRLVWWFHDNPEQPSD